VPYFSSISEFQDGNDSDPVNYVEGGSHDPIHNPGIFLEGQSHWITHSQFSLNYDAHKSSLMTSQLSLTITCCT
jgi:hypothetical protein